MNDQKLIMSKQIIAIIYDGISNSVFESQVLQPLLKKKELGTNITLISFEKNYSLQIPPSIPKDVTVIVLKKYPYCGRVSLWSAIHQTKNILKQFSGYCVLARGPLAGYIAKQAVRSPHCQEICIQARGLLAEEYAYTNGHSNGFMKLVHTIRKWLYSRLEYKVYSLSNRVPIHIEAVSPALKDYLIDRYTINPSKISVAHNDIPIGFDKDQIFSWRQKIRNQLKIDHHTEVFCYNGSAKAWQCPEMVIDYFRKYQEKNRQSFLFILTQDATIFERLLSKSGIDKNDYCIKNIPHSQVYCYLAASDYGMIFRQPHLINWTSRPTKVLEYQAIGLPIIHNNTIEMLCNNYDIDASVKIERTCV